MVCIRYILGYVMVCIRYKYVSDKTDTNARVLCGIT